MLKHAFIAAAGALVAVFATAPSGPEAMAADYSWVNAQGKKRAFDLHLVQFFDVLTGDLNIDPKKSGKIQLKSNKQLKAGGPLKNRSFRSR
jgi:hypothetical protein